MQYLLLAAHPISDILLQPYFVELVVDYRVVEGDESVIKSTNLWDNDWERVSNDARPYVPGVRRSGDITPRHASRHGQRCVHLCTERERDDDGPTQTIM